METIRILKKQYRRLNISDSQSNVRISDSVLPVNQYGDIPHNL